MYEKEFIQAADIKEERMEQSIEGLNLFTAVDENMPSPEVVQAEGTIILPEIQSMLAYIRQHYEGAVIRRCAQKIVDAELVAVYEGKRFRKTSRHDSLDCEEEIVLTDEERPDEWEELRSNQAVGGIFAADIRPVKGAITWMSFRRVAECCVEADLTIEMELHFRYGSRGRFKQTTQRYYADMWLDMGGWDQRGIREFPHLSSYKEQARRQAGRVSCPGVQMGGYRERSRNHHFEYGL